MLNLCNRIYLNLQELLYSFSNYESMKKFGALGVLCLLLIFALFYFNTTPTKNKRELFEEFLHQEYEKIPSFSNIELKDIPKPTHPDLAAIQNYFMTIDPNEERVPVERLKSAYQTTKAIQKSTNYKSASNISWEEIPSSMAGRIRTAMYDPNDPFNKKVWAGTVTGGLWYNDDITDENSSWESVEDFWPSLAISSIVYDPNNTQTFYVGTGEAQTALTIYRESSGVGAGIYKTTDGGNTWNLLESTKNFKYVTDIAIKNEDGHSVIYAGIVSGFYKGASHQSSPSDGLYRSDDHGNTWEQVLPDITNSDQPYAPSDIEITANGRIFVGTMRNLEDKGGACILYSDEGTKNNWTLAIDYQNKIESSPSENIPGRVVLASAPTDPNRLYALIGAGFINENDGLKRSIGKYILKSTEAGEIWTELDVPDNNGSWATIAWHALAVEVNPGDEDMVYIGGLNCFKSDDGGASWYRISDWAGVTYPFVHADIHRYVFNPKNSNQLLVCTDGGIFYTMNSNTTAPLFKARNKDLNCLQFYTCDIAPGNGNINYLGGLQDNGSIIFRGNRIDRNSIVTGGDGAYCFFDKTNANHFITSIYHNYYIFHYRQKSVTNLTHYNTGTFINPADYDSYQNILYANATTLKNKFQNQLVRYKGVPDNVTSGYISITSDVNVPFSHIKVSPHSKNSSTLFAGTQSGRLFKITRADEAPSTIEIGDDEFPAGNISCVAVGGSEDSLLVTFSNYGLSSVWQTYDGGTSWEEKEGNLPDMPIRWAIYYPNNSKKALLATELGVWYTDELNTNDPDWEPVNEGLANVRVDMLKLREDDNTILAATHGRGFAIANTETISVPGDINQPDNGFSIYPNPTQGNLNLNFSLTRKTDVRVVVFDQTGKMCYFKEYKTLFGDHTISLNLKHLSKGNYFVKLETEDQIFKEKIIIQ